MKRAPHKRQQHHYRIGQALCSDIVGPFRPMVLNKEKYLITATDIASRMLFVQAIESRTQAAEFLDTVAARVRAVTGRHPQVLKTDNALEFLSKATRNAVQTHGMTHSKTTPYPPQENGIAERINQTICSTARKNLEHSNLEDAYWADACRDATYKYNLMTHSITNQIPYVAFYGKPRKWPPLFIFGQLGYIPNANPRSKLDNRGQLARYLYGTERSRIVVETVHDGKRHSIRAVDLHP